jgi:hypothetical protein
VGPLVPLPALCHFHGEGIGFPQRSCKAEARCVAKVLPRATPEAGWEQLCAIPTEPEDQEDAAETVEVALAPGVVLPRQPER